MSAPRSSALSASVVTCAALLCALLAGFAWLRVATGHYGFWFDEFATLIFADQPLRHLWGSWMVRETNPPLFYTMVKGWQALGFRSEAALRWLPELGGGLGLALLTTAAGLGWGWRAAVPALVLAGLSAQHVHASQLLRGYIFAADSVTLACIGLLLVLRDGPGSARLRGWALYVSGSVLAIHFHTTMVLWPLAATLALPLAAGRAWRAALRGTLIAGCLIALLSGWWLWITLQQIRTHSGNIAWIPPLSPRDYLWMVSQSVLLVREAIGGDHRLSKLIALALVAGTLLTLRHPATRLVLACVVLGAGLQGAVALVQPVATQATLFWLSTFVVLLLAGGIGSLRPPAAAAGTLIALAAVLGLNLIRSAPAQVEGDFTRALHQAHDHPPAVLLVEHASMGAVAAKACTVAWPDHPCPVRIIALASPLRSDSWAIGLGPRPLAPAAVRAAVVDGENVFTLRSAGYDPALRFGLAGTGATGGERAYLEGPFPAARLDPAGYRPPDPSNGQTPGH